MSTADIATPSQGADDRRRPPTDQRWTVLRPSGSERPSDTLATTRHLLGASAAREVRSRYTQNVGRGVWMVVQPAAMVLIYGFVFFFLKHLWTSDCSGTLSKM